MVSYMRVIALSVVCAVAMYLYAMDQDTIDQETLRSVLYSAYERPGQYDDSRIIGKASSEPSSPVASDEESTSPDLSSQNRRSRSHASRHMMDVDTLELSGGLIVQINKKLHRDLDKLNSDFHEALDSRNRHPNFRKAEGLLRAGADINSLDKYGVPAVITAVRNRSFPVLEFLVKKGADLNKQEGKQSSKGERVKGYSALHIAVTLGYTPFVRYLLEKGANPNIADQHNTTPIFLTVFATNDRVQVARLLLNAGANLSVINTQGDTPITFAKQFQGSEELVAYLKRKKLEQDEAEQRRKEKEEAAHEANLIY